MIPTTLQLPHRPTKPRPHGITMVIDNGLPLGAFRTHVQSTGDLIDFVNFGWGTPLVTRVLPDKLAALDELEIPFFFGGTLFEKYLSRNAFDDFRAFCLAQGCRYVEVSNGTIDLPNDEKARYVDKLAGDFVVFSEVGVTDSTSSEALTDPEWWHIMRQDLQPRP